MAIATSSPTLPPAVDAWVCLRFISQAAFMQIFTLQLSGNGGWEYPGLCWCPPTSTVRVLLSPAISNTSHHSPLPSCWWASPGEGGRQGSPNHVHRERKTFSGNKNLLISLYFWVQFSGLGGKAAGTLSLFTLGAGCSVFCHCKLWIWFHHCCLL